MTIQTTRTNSDSKRLLKSVTAVFLGFIAVVVLSLGTDQLLHSLQVYPPWDEPMNDTGLLLLALTYRTVYGVLGSYIAARLAPRNPMRHALALGVIGLALSTVGVIVAITTNLGPAWYAIAIVVTAMPGAWLGGALYRNKPNRTFTNAPIHDA